MNNDSNFWNSVVCFVLVLSCAVIGPEHFSEETYHILSIGTFIFGVLTVVYAMEAVVNKIIEYIKQKRGSGNE